MEGEKKQFDAVQSDVERLRALHVAQLEKDRELEAQMQATESSRQNEKVAFEQQLQALKQSLDRFVDRCFDGLAAFLHANTAHFFF